MPQQVIETLIDYTLRNPDKMPPNHSSIDITKEPTIKEPKEVIIEGAVEIYDSPDDPRLSIIKHKEGISLVDKEEADILQEKINDALKLQKEETEQLQEGFVHPYPQLTEKKQELFKERFDTYNQWKFEELLKKAIK